MRIDGLFWAALDCTAIPENRLGKPVALAGPDIPWLEFRALDSHEGWLIAGRPEDASGCPGGGWTALTGGGGARTREAAFGRHRDYCTLFEPPHELCRDRVIEWRISENGDKVGYGYLPERIERVNARVAAGDPASTWRLDPFEVLRREPYWQRCAGFPGLRCRAGARVQSRAEDRIAIRVLEQHGDREFKQYRSEYTHFALERLGGAGWWLVERHSGRDVNHPGRGDIARISSDQLWAGCCRVVLFDAHADTAQRTGPAARGGQ